VSKKSKQPKTFKILPFDFTNSRKWCIVLDAPNDKDIYDIAEELWPLAEQYPAYSFMVTERLSVEVSEDRKKRLL
jgi:hypothetical protein